MTEVLDELADGVGIPKTVLEKFLLKLKVKYGNPGDGIIPLTDEEVSEYDSLRAHPLKNPFLVRLSLIMAYNDYLDK